MANTFGLAFRLDDHIQEIYKQFDFHLSRINADGSWDLPAPETFVNADYTRRAEPSDVIAALKALP